MSCRAKTLVHMLDGSLRLIEQVKPGDRLQGSEGIVRIQDVLHGQEERLIHICTQEGKTLEATYNQLVMTLKGFVHAKYLKPGDDVVTFINDIEKIKLVEILQPAVYEVFQLQTKDATPYYANEILVGDVGQQSKE